VFSNLFFVIAILLLISTVSSSHPHHSVDQFWLIASLAAFTYLGTLLLIFLQNRNFRKRLIFAKEQLIFLSNIELILLFVFLFFVIEVQQVIFLVPVAPFEITTLTVATLLAYFFGLAVSYYSCESTQSSKESVHRTWRSIRFLLPFTIPFLIFILVSEGVSLFNVSIDDSMAFYVVSLATLVGFIGIVILYPPLIVWLWRCRNLEDRELLVRLDALCKRADFKHAGFKIWTIMEGALTAAIIGVIKQFRYVMFTPALLQRLSPDAIEAVLAHEIGHHRYKHLLIYPFILFGMIISGMIGSSLIYDLIVQDPMQVSSEFESLLTFVLFIISAALYFRYIFGYFSRLFERQADLYVFELKVPPEHLIDALNALAIGSGVDPHLPNWHHFGIQKRIDFIRSVERNPTLFQRYQRKVYFSLIVYFVILALSFFIIT